MKKLTWFASLAAFVAYIPVIAGGQPTSSLNCKVGPIEKIYGGTNWLVYGCDDRASIVIVTTPGNPAAPFYFFFNRQSDGYHLHGEGSGDKRLTDLAYKDLAALSQTDIAALASAVRH